MLCMIDFKLEVMHTVDDPLLVQLGEGNSQFDVLGVPRRIAALIDGNSLVAIFRVAAVERSSHLDKRVWCF